MSVEQLFTEYQKLSVGELSRFHKLMESLDDDMGISPAQAAELDRRVALLDSGKVKTIPGEKAMQELAEKHGLQLPS